MYTNNRIIIKQATESFGANFFLAIGGYWIYILYVTLVAFIPYIGIITILGTIGPLILGRTFFFMSISQKNTPKLKQLLFGFSNNFKSSLMTYLLMVIIIFFSAIFFIVPGIIASLSYSMTFYILVDNPMIGTSKALRKSKKMMEAYKWKYFQLISRFVLIPLILCCLILIPAISIVFTMPTPKSFHELWPYLQSIYHFVLNVILLIFKDSPLYLLIIFLAISLVLTFFHISSAKFYNTIKEEYEAKEILIAKEKSTD